MSTIINKVTNTNPLFEVGASVAAELGTSLIEPTGLVGSPNWYGAEPLQSTMYYAFLPVIVGSTISFDRVIEFNIPPSYFESTSHTFRGKTTEIPTDSRCRRGSIVFVEDQYLTITNYFHKWKSLVASSNGVGWNPVNYYKKPILLVAIGAGENGSGIFFLNGCHPYSINNLSFNTNKNDSIITPQIEFECETVEVLAIWDVMSVLALSNYTTFFPLGLLGNLLATILQPIQQALEEKFGGIIAGVFNK